MSKHDSNQSDETSEVTLSPAVTWAILIIVIGIIPWSIFAINTIGPALGIHQISFKGILLLIIAPAALLIWLVNWVASLRK